MSTFPNVYTHRKVADTASKSCAICYKLSTSVLITEGKQDFFYVCPSHLKDKGFCTPIVDQAAIDAQKKKDLDDEIARVKKEYEEKQRKKKEKEEGDKSNEKADDKKEASTTDKKDQAKKPDSTSATKEGESTKAEEEPRIFQLHRTFYQNRVTMKRQAEADKRNRERFSNPAFFPSVPKGLP
ncbi:VPS4-associated protein 1 [Coniella lustricola]|uniref:VPS4-associated protein 1 n=1 Tax=Coniella lustricola TaxID=2025994 RepID=A0A2T3ACS2_9PEZI|nr:VPS4-associated protein 1 [Coniella lustricola]